MSYELIRKYTRYAKKNIKPKLQSSENEKIARLYADLRRESSIGATTPISIRQLESTLRMAEAHAKLHLRKFVSSDDVDFAITVTVKNYINLQKIELQETLRHKLLRFIVTNKDHCDLFIFLLRKLVQDQLKTYAGKKIKDSLNLETSQLRIKIQDLKARLKEYNIVEWESFLNDPRFNLNGFSLSKDKSFIIYSDQ